MRAPRGAPRLAQTREWPLLHIRIGLPSHEQNSAPDFGLSTLAKPSHQACALALCRHHLVPYGLAVKEDQRAALGQQIHEVGAGHIAAEDSKLPPIVRGPRRLWIRKIADKGDRTPARATWVDSFKAIYVPFVEAADRIDHVRGLYAVAEWPANDDLELCSHRLELLIQHVECITLDVWPAGERSPQVIVLTIAAHACAPLKRGKKRAYLLTQSCDEYR